MSVRVEQQSSSAGLANGGGGQFHKGHTARRPQSAGTLARLRRVRQRRYVRPASDRAQDEYAFLVGHLIDEATLRRAEIIARSWRVATHEALIALGWLAEADYVAALARSLGLPVVAAPRMRAVHPFATYPPWPKVLAAMVAGREVVVVEARSFAPQVLRAIATSADAKRQRFALASRFEMARTSEHQVAPVLIDRAVNLLWRRAPDLSARTPHPLWQVMFVAALIGIGLGGLAQAPELIAPLLAAFLTVPFLCVVALRTAALLEIVSRRGCASKSGATPEPQDWAMPVYSVLVPLLREAEVLPQLVKALTALDYPAAKLQILLLLESDDTETRTAAVALDLPGNFEIIIIPDRGPRTKPKALNYALQLVKGEFVVIYDAEDVPEPDQLRRAIATFRAAGPELACVQAGLNVYNHQGSWLARQFALEYSALFDAILPALERFHIPIPLGGTSNHFRAKALRSVGGWDPYNVTEDADLGLRLARSGLATVTLNSTTWEEAPVRLGNWMRQRTRWIKGWMLTYMVHMREPAQLLADVGWWRCAGLQVLIGGILLSVLFHPLCYALLAWEAGSSRPFAIPQDTLERWLWWIAIVNLVIGYASAIIVAALAAVRRGRPGLALHALTMPLYWLLISVAGYRALIQLIRSPYLWEKTQHGAAHGTRPPGAKAG